LENALLVNHVNPTLFLGELVKSCAMADSENIESCIVDVFSILFVHVCRKKE